MSRAATQAQQTGRRPRPGTLEREALRAAGAGPGARDLARGLSRTAAAARPALPGPGRPLPALLRRDAETAFGADFAAVRVHERAAVLEGVRAATAGADILLAGRALPAGEVGRRLVFHELAHVVQQTGRLAADGRLQARRLDGRGPLHADGGELPGTNAPARDALLEHLIQLHRKGQSDAALATADPDLFVIIVLLRARLAAGYEVDSPTQAGRDLEKEVLADSIPGLAKPVTSLSQGAHNLLFDALKFAGLYDGALFLLDNCWKIETAFYWVAFHEFVLAKLGDLGLWGVLVLERDAKLKAFLTWVMPETYWNYLIDPDRQIQSLYGFDSYLKEVDEISQDWSRLGANERVISAVFAIQILDKARLKFLAEKERAAKSISKSGPMLKLRMAGAVIDLVEAQLQIAGLPEVLKTSLTNTLAVTRRAQEYWTAVVDRIGKGNEALKLVDVSKLTPDQRAELLIALPDIPEVAELRSRLGSQATGLFALEGDLSFPSQHAYAKRVAAFQGAIGKLRVGLSEALRKGLPKQADAASETGYVALGAALHWLDLVDNLLGSYDAKADRESESTRGAADVRIWHRLRVARHLHDLALLLGATELEQVAAAVQSGTDRGRSTLILISEWAPQQDVIFTDIQKDFDNLSTQKSPGVELGGGGFGTLPFAMDQIVEFYRLVYDRALAAALRSLLQVTPTAFEPKRKPIIVQAYQKASQADLPQRWHVEEAALVRVVGDNLEFLDLISEHPKTKADLIPLRQPLGGLIGPENYRYRASAGGGPDVFAWLFPPFVPLIEELKKVDIFNALIGPTEADARALPSEQWLVRFIEESDKLDDLTEIEEALETHLETARGAEKTKLKTLIPAAITHERITIVPLLRKALQDYTDDNIKYYSRPNQALDWLQGFARFAQPPEDVAGQIGALIAALAPDIKAAFSVEYVFGTEINETRFDIITGYMGLLKLGARMTQESNWAEVQRILAPGEEGAQSDGKIDRKAANQQLNHVIKRFEEQAAKIAERISVRTDGTTQLLSNISSLPVKVGDPFIRDGVEWSIVKIHREFIYLPPYGRGESQVRPPTLLTKDRKPLPSTGAALVTIRMGAGANEVDITDQLSGHNLERLDELARVVAGRAVQLGFQNTAAVIDAFGNLIQDLVECIPGAGQAVMAARIVVQVAEFFASGKYQEIAALVRGDPVRLLKELLENLTTKFFKPDLIWEYLLFDAAPLESLRKKGEENEAKGRQSRSKKGKIGRVIRTISRLGLTVHEKINAVKRRVEPRVRAIQFFIQGRPKVAAAIDFASLIATSPGFGVPGELLGALSGGVDEEKIGDRLAELVQSINDFELPKDLIDNVVVVDAILEVIIDIVARGCIGLAVETILDATGLREEIAADIARSLAGTAADPNVIWRDEFRPQLEDAVAGAKKDFVESVTTILGRFGIGAFNPPVETDLGQADFLELEGHDAKPAAAPPPVVALGAGRPLPAAMRRGAERGFGHDFGHVRLHSDAAAAALTRHYGADALTSGSHVLLAPGLDPGRGAGRRILHHELGHVLQQAGPRPLGARNADRPVLGRPRRGLRLDRVAEGEADRLAAAAARPGHRIGQPLRLESRGAEGYAPALGGASFARILRKFNEAKEIGEFQEDIEKQATTTVTADHLTETKRIWEDCWKELRANARTGAGFKGHSGDDGVPDLIKDYITETGEGRPRGDVEKALPVLTKRAEKTKGKPPNTHTEFNARLFANLLEGYLYARSGVSVNIALDRLGKFASVKVLSVDLGRAGPTGNLWAEVRDRTNAHINAAKGLDPTGKQHWKALEGRDWTKLGNMLRIGGPQAEALHRSKFRISDEFLEQFFLFLAQATNVVVPAWTDYTTTATLAQQGEPRLRVGTHKQLTKDVAVSGRQSHHIPQFLLLQYFRNQANQPLFDGNERPRLPGFTPDGAAEPTGFSDGTHRIDLQALHAGKKGDSSSRGLGMPAISLAKTTHETAGLHVGASNGLDEEGDASATQGRTIEAEFQKRFIAATPEGDYVAAARWANQPQNKNRVGPAAVYSAIKGTYDWMYDDLMRPALVRGLRNVEARYYATIATGQSGATNDKGQLLQQYDPLHAIGRLDELIAKVDELQLTNPIKGFRG